MDPERLRQLLALAGSKEYAGDVSVVGEDPVYRTQFRIGEAAAVALAGCAALAARAWEERTDRRQDVSVNVRAAAAAHRGTEYMRLDGKPVTRELTALAGQYKTRDGRWVRLNGLTPRFRDGTLAVLGCDDEEESLAAAVCKWSGTELEEALAAKGLSGAMARTATEWEAHPQGKAIAKLPVVEVIKIGDGPAEPAGMGNRPLGGTRVLDLSLALAGPTAARTLAEHGADVMRVGAPHLPEYRTSLISTGHGKLAAQLDIRSDADRARLWDLATHADVFSQSFRTGAMARRGFSPEALAEARPGIIYVSINCYGHAGPWVERPGWDYMAQAVTGMSVQAGTADKPGRLPVPANDYVAGYLAAYGAMIALLRRAREGGSYHVRTSLCQVASWILQAGLVEKATADKQPEDLDPDEIAAWMIETETPFGRLRHLAPVAQMPETPPQWDRPTAPIGHDAPVWPQPPDEGKARRPSVGAGA